MREMKDSGIEWIGKIPADWTLQWGKTIFAQRLTKGNQSEILLAATQKYGMLPQSEVEGVVQVKEDADLQQFRTVHKKDFVISLRSFQGGFEYSQYEGVCSPAYQVFYNTNPICHNYYRLLFKSDGFIQKMNSMTVGIREGKNIQYSDFANSLIPVPPINQQQRIADYLDRKCSQIDTIIARQQEVIEKLKAYKLSVITEAVTKGLNPDVPMKDSGIPWVGNICNHYALSRVGAFCFVTKLAGFEYTDIMSSAISDTGEVPIVRAQNVRMFNFNDNIDEYIGLDVSQKLYRCALNKKCLLITFIGAGIGDVCVFSKTMRYHLAPNVAKIEIRDEYKTILDEEYLMFYLGSLAGKGEISKISKASAQPSLSMGTIRGITIAVPPIDEQREISEYLSKKIAFIDKVVRDKESIIENLLAYKSSLIYEVVTGKKEV